MVGGAALVFLSAYRMNGRASQGPRFFAELRMTWAGLSWLAAVRVLDSRFRGNDEGGGENDGFTLRLRSG